MLCTVQEDALYNTEEDCTVHLQEFKARRLILKLTKGINFSHIKVEYTTNTTFLAIIFTEQYYVQTTEYYILNTNFDSKITFTIYFVHFSLHFYFKNT